MHPQPMSLRSGAFELFQAEIDSNNKISDNNPLLGARNNAQLIQAFAGKAPAGPHAPEFNRALANVDFQNLLGDMLTSSLNSPLEFKSTHSNFTDTRFLPNFKPASLYDVGSFALLPKEPGGEYKNAELSGYHVIGQLKTYARKLLITRDAYVSADFVIVDRMIQNVRREARRLEDELVYTAMEDNAVSPDGNAFFSQENNNILTSATIDISALSEAAELLANQTDIDGRRIGTVATTLISSSLNQFLTEETFARMPGSTIRRIYSPLIKTSAWYVTGDTPFCSVLRLAGSDGEVEVKAGTKFNTDNLVFHCRTDLGAALTNYRAAVRCN